MNGALELGSSWLNAYSLESNAAAIAGWGRGLTSGGDILLYGCNVAADSQGQRFVERIAELTGADVSDSLDATGSAILGGNWALEYATGSIDVGLALTAQAQQEYDHILAITVGNTSSAFTTGASSLSFSHSIASGGDGILIVTVSYKAKNVSVTSVTYGGVGLTLLGFSEYSGGDDTRTEMWMLKNPTTGTANVVIAASQNNQIYIASATNFFGVDQTTSTGSYVAATGSGGAMSVTVASAVGELVIDSVGGRAVSSGTVGANQTQLSSYTTGGGGSDVFHASSIESGASSVTMSWTAGSTEWAAGAISLKPANTAPVLNTSASPTLSAINEDVGAPSGAVGTLVSQLVDFASPSGQLDNVTDPDSGAGLGIAVTAANSANGSWYYSTNNGSTWNALGSVSNGNARLLAADASTRLYFQPVANYSGTIADAITFRAWDRYTGSNGALANTSTNGGSTAFSAATDTAALTVTAINDAPLLDNSGSMTLTTISEDQTSNAGNTIASIIASAGGDRITEVDSGAVEGIAITALTSGTGTWEYSTNAGGSWTAVGTVTNTSALLLRSTDLVRFIPDGQNATSGDITFRAWTKPAARSAPKSIPQPMAGQPRLAPLPKWLPLPSRP